VQFASGTELDKELNFVRGFFAEDSELFGIDFQVQRLVRNVDLKVVCVFYTVGGLG
jgi:hypothetical protein